MIKSELTNELFSSLIEWQSEPNAIRQISINIGGSLGKDTCQIIIQDQRLWVGKVIESIEDLNNFDPIAKKKEDLDYQIKLYNEANEI